MRIGNLPGGLQTAMSMAVPNGWYFKESFTAMSPDGQANVIFSSEPLNESFTTEEYAQVQSDLLMGEFPNYREISLEEFALRDEGVAVMRVFGWSPPDGDPVTQMQMYYVVAGRGYTATATTLSTNFSEICGVLIDALRSISVTVGGEAGAPPQ
jgi:hypothetical protein